MAAVPWRPNACQNTGLSMEVNAIFTALEGLQTRTDLLRGYL